MEQVVPWQELCAPIEQFYPKAGNGRLPIGLERKNDILGRIDDIAARSGACNRLKTVTRLRAALGHLMHKDPSPGCWVVPAPGSRIGWG